MFMKVLILKETVTLPWGRWGGPLYDYETDQSKFKKPFGHFANFIMSLVEINKYPGRDLNIACAVHVFFFLLKYMYDQGHVVWRLTSTEHEG